MSTTVRIQPQDKARLDRVQARFLLQTGKRLSLDAILHRMLEVAARHEDEVIEADAPPRLTPEQKKKVLSLPTDFGFDTSPRTIDEELYGDAS